MTTTPAHDPLFFDPEAKLPHNEYRSADGRLIRLINDDVLVRMDKLRERTAGGIIIPETVGDRGDAGILNTGTIVAFGFMKFGDKEINGEYIPFQKIPLPELCVGLKTVFVRYLAEQHTNKYIQHIFGENLIRIKPLDLVLVYDPEDHHRVLF